jgi:hypothetical protein
MVESNPNLPTSWHSTHVFKYEKALKENKFVAGLSFDLQKCFDTVPFNLALDVFSPEVQTHALSTPYDLFILITPSSSGWKATTRCRFNHIAE